MTNINHSQVFKWIEQWAPKKLAYDWDPIGLQVGNPTSKTKNILVTLDVVEAVVDEAIKNRANLIVAHHPLLFRPLKNLNVTSPKGKTIEKIVKNDITVYAAHTNLDIAEGGVNDLLANRLSLKNIKSLVPVTEEQLYKVMVYVPHSHIDKIREAFHKGGAGHIGNYSHCTFQVKGQGTFKPLEGTNPYSGQVNELTYVDEAKVESIVPETTLSKVIREIKKAHPYEEVAYDIYKMENKGRSYGLGRIGQLEEEMTLEQFASYLKERFHLEGLKVTGNLTSKVKNVAIVGGSGEKYIHAAKKQQADVYVTGDMTFHPAQEAMEMGLSVIDAGHYIEKIMIKAMKEYLVNKLNNENIKIYSSKVDTNPFKIM